MFTVATVLNALELGFIYALVAMALFLSFRVLNIADMTTDGAFTLGCAVSATAAVAGHPFLGLPLAMLAGAAAGFITAFLQTKLAVPSILAGIITNTGLYTVNLAVMGFSSNVPMLKTKTVFTAAQGVFGESAPYKLIVAALVTVVVCALLIASAAGAFAAQNIGTAKAKAIARKLRDLSGVKIGKPAYTWSAPFGVTKDGLPIIDRVPGFERCFAVMGFGGNGITYSVIASQVVGRAIRGRRDPDADLYRP